MLKAIVVLALLVAPLVGQQGRQLNDGEMHGDPPFLLEDGWSPLMNGKDLAGWRGQGSNQNEWFTATGVVWSVCWPTRLSGGPRSGGAM